MLPNDTKGKTDDLGGLLAFDIAETMESDDPWDRLFAGELTAPEAVALAKEAEPDREESELWRIAEGFRSPSAERKAKERDAVLRAYDEAKPDEPAKVIPMPSRTKRIVATTGMAAAAAAAVLLMMRPDEPAAPLPEASIPEASPLPTYELELQSWAGKSLGPTSAPPPDHCQTRVHEDHDLEVSLRPETRVDRKLGVMAWAVSSDGETALDLELVATIEDSGFIDVRRPVSELGLTPGDWTLTFVVGAPATLEGTSRAELGDRQDVVMLQRSVCVVK